MSFSKAKLKRFNDGTCEILPSVAYQPADAAFYFIRAYSLSQAIFGQKIK